MQNNAMWCVIVPAMASCQAGKKQKGSFSSLFVQHVGLLQKGCKEEVPLRLVHQIVKKRCASAQLPFIFHFPLLKTQLLNHWVASLASLWLRSQKLFPASKCFIQDQEKNDGWIWVVCQNDREIKKLRVYEEAYKVYVPTQRKGGQNNRLLCDASLPLLHKMPGVKERRPQKRRSLP